MRYSFALISFGAGAALAAMQPAGEYTDGQIQISTGAASPMPAPSVTTPPVEEETVYSTKHIIITSCPPEVVNCPARHSSTVVPVVVSKPNSPATAIPPPVVSTSVPVVVPVSSAPAPSSPPTSPNSPAQPPPVVASSACPTCPTCPAPVTVYSTVTVAPSAPAVPVASSPVSPQSPASPPSESGSTPNSPAQGSAVPPPPGAVPTVSVPGGVAPPSPTGTAASSGVVVSQPSSSPITPFKGAASTMGSSMGLAGLAAFAAIFFA